MPLESLDELAGIQFYLFSAREMKYMEKEYGEGENAANGSSGVGISGRILKKVAVFIGEIRVENIANARGRIGRGNILAV